MPILSNPQWEQFCQALHRCELEFKPPKQARDEAYVAAGYDKEQKHLSDNARKLSHKPDIRKRMDELRTRTAQLAELDAGWAMLHLKSYVQGNPHGNPPVSAAEKVSERISALHLMADIGGWKKPNKTALTDPSGENPAEPFVIEILRFSDANPPAAQQLAPAGAPA